MNTNPITSVTMSRSPSITSELENLQNIGIQIPQSETVSPRRPSKILVRTLRNQTLSLKLNTKSSVQELKDMIQQQHGIPIETQQLFHHGRLLKKDDRRLSKYRVDENTTADRPVLLLQKFKAKVVCSHKVMSLYALTMDHHIKKLHPKQQINCVSTTTIAAVLEQLNLSHLSHLVKFRNYVLPYSLYIPYIFPVYFLYIS